jgi:hypothetical protein
MESFVMRTAVNRCAAMRTMMSAALLLLVEAGVGAYRSSYTRAVAAPFEPCRRHRAGQLVPMNMAND